MSLEYAADYADMSVVGQITVMVSHIQPVGILVLHASIGTKQFPFQSAEGALRARGLNITLWTKRRYTNTDR